MSPNILHILETEDRGTELQGLNIRLNLIQCSKDQISVRILTHYPLPPRTGRLMPSVDVQDPLTDTDVQDPLTITRYKPQYPIPYPIVTRHRVDM